MRILVFLMMISTAHAGTFTDLGVYPVSPVCEDALSATCRTDADYSSLSYDNGKVYLNLGGGHAATYNNSVPELDPITLSWSWPWPNTPCADMTDGNVDSYHGRWISDNRPIDTHSYDLNAVLPDGRILQAAVVQGRGKGCNNLTPSGQTGYVYVIAAEEAGRDEVDLTALDAPDAVKADDTARAELQAAIDNAEGT